MKFFSVILVVLFWFSHSFGLNLDTCSQTKGCGVPLNGACDSSLTCADAGDVFCNNVTNPGAAKCTGLLAEGEACQFFYDCDSYDCVSDGVTGPYGKKCAALSTAAPKNYIYGDAGDRCNFSNDTTVYACKSGVGLSCWVGGAVCILKSALNQQCNSTQPCVFGAQCEFGRCVALYQGQLGANCSTDISYDHDLCGLGYYCNTTTLTCASGPATSSEESCSSTNFCSKYYESCQCDQYGAQATCKLSVQNIIPGVEAACQCKVDALASCLNSGSSECLAEYNEVRCCMDRNERTYVNTMLYEAHSFRGGSYKEDCTSGSSCSSSYTACPVDSSASAVLAGSLSITLVSALLVML